MTIDQICRWAADLEAAAEKLAAEAHAVAVQARQIQRELGKPVKREARG